MKVLKTPSGWNNNWQSLPRYSAPLDEVPPGFQTTAQIARDLDVESATALRWIKQWLSDGLIEAAKFKVKAGSAVRTLPHYRRIKHVKAGKN